MILRYALRRILFVFLISLSVQSCSTPPETESSQQTNEQASNQADTVAVSDNAFDSIPDETLSIPKVLIVPCSNGYQYNLRQGDVNPSLEKYLAQDERIEVLDFPYVAMNGAGYFGVYDKKHCHDILKHTDADFLIMTRMSGGLEPMIRTDTSTVHQPNWGYSTKILNREKMEQFNGISVKNLSKFNEIDTNVKRKVSVLIESILASHNSEP